MVRRRASSPAPSTPRAKSRQQEQQDRSSNRSKRSGRGPRAATPTQTRGTVFEKLTDPREYTGHHKHRFDPDSGKGKGRQGRDTVQKGTGTRPGSAPIVQDKITCISQLMRPDFYATDGGGSSAKKGGAKGAQDLTPEPTRPETEGTIFERLTDSRLYTGHHKHRFDPETGEGKGLAGRESLSKGLGTVSHVEIRPDDNRVLCTSELFRPHFKPHGGSDSARGKRRAQSPGQVTVPEIEAGSIFEKLTSPTSFTGAHKHRFDEEGRGLGLEGRDKIIKGNVGHAAPSVLALRDGGGDKPWNGGTGVRSPRARSPKLGMGRKSPAPSPSMQRQHHRPTSPSNRALVREV